MINRLLVDMNKALGAEAYMAALAVALILPDMCGKAEYPNIENSKERYVKWYDEYLGQYNKDINKNENYEKVPYLSGEVVYQLRCMFLHSGTPSIDKEKITEKTNKIDIFKIIIEKKNPLDLYFSSSGILYYNSGIKKSVYDFNIRNFCKDLETAVKIYYQDNKTKFNFSNLHIIDKIG